MRLRPDSIPSLFEVFSLTTEAWITERTTDAKLRIIKSRTRLMEAELASSEAKYHAQTSVAIASRHYEETLHNRLPDRKAFEELVPLTRALLERQTSLEGRLKSQELALASRGKSIDLPPPPPPLSLDIDISDHQIEAMAARGVHQLSGLSANDQQRAFETFKAEAKKRLPLYAADEVIRRAEELRRLVR